MKPNVEKTFQGALRLSTIINGYSVSQQYMGYSLADAKRKFADYIKQIEK